MNCFFRAKIIRFFVVHLRNRSLLRSMYALNRTIFSPEKLNSDLIRGSLGETV